MVQLSEGPDAFNGELWDIATDAAGNVAVAGVDHAAAHGMVYSIGTQWSDDGYDASGWHAFNVAEILGASRATWARGVCREGPHVVAVGEFSALGDGFMIRSRDGGRTFTDVTPDVVAALPSGASLGPLHRCQFADPTTVVAAGADGAFVRYSWSN